MGYPLVCNRSALGTRFAAAPICESARGNEPLLLPVAVVVIMALETIRPTQPARAANHPYR